MNKISEKNRDTLQEMRKGYEEIPVPNKGREMVEQTIERAKRDKRRKRKLIWLRNTAAGAAAAFACIIVLANSSPQIAHAMEQVPVLGAVVRAVTLRTYEAKEGDYEADAEIPQIVAEGGQGELTEGTEEINMDIQQFTDQLISEFEADRKEYTDGRESLDISYETVVDNERLYTIKVWAVQTAASGAETVRYYTLDKTAGRQLHLKDLFEEGSDYVSVLSDLIKSQMRAQMQADEGKVYFLDDEDVPESNFEKIQEDQNFYINEGGHLVIVFDEYEVAPGYMGVVSFEIPTEEIAEILRPDVGLLK